MTKKLLFLVCMFALAGCSYGQNYLKNPETFIRDPHFADYKEKRDDVEREYLHKEITYAEYLEQKGELDETYDKEVQERADKIMSKD